MRYLIFLLVALSVSNRSYADVIDKANVDETKHITDLQNCRPSTYEQTREIAGQKVTLSWEVKGVEDNHCRLQIKNSADGNLNCLVPLDKLAAVLSEDSDVNIDNYCQATESSSSAQFQDANGVDYDCNTKLNVQMVSVEECSRCPNRRIVEDKKIKLGKKNLTYCVLSQCPSGYKNSSDGLCKIDKVVSEEQTPMKQYFIDNKSDKLIVFFAGWGCDEHQFANLKDRNYDVLVYEIELGAEPDPIAYYHSSQAKESGLNLSSYRSTLVDDLLIGARETLDDNLRAKKYESFLEYWVSDVPAIGLYQANLTYVYNKNVKTYGDYVRLVTGLDRFSDITGWAAVKGTKNLTP